MRGVRKYRRIKADSPMAGSTVLADAIITAKRPRNVVDALFKHFRRWQPTVAESAKVGDDICQQHTKDAFQK
jgi:hypothetical protein